MENAGSGNTGEDKRVFIHETVRYVEALTNFGFSRVIGQSHAVHELRFCGDVVIRSTRNRAHVTAENIFQCNAGRRHRVFYVDASQYTSVQPKSGSSTLKDIPAISSGAAVVYKPPTPRKDRHWQERLFAPVSRGRDSVFAELAAIARGLTIALAEMTLYLDENKRTSNGKGRWSKVTIFSDCTHALQKICKLRENAITDAQSLGDPIIHKLITISQYFYQNGVQLELRWVPNDSNVEGNVRADAAARFAAQNQDVGMILEESLQ